MTPASPSSRTPSGPAPRTSRSRRSTRSTSPCWMMPPQFAEYEAGNLDSSPRRRWPTSTASRPTRRSSKELSIAPQLCTYYYGFNTKAPVVDDVRVRRALSMAIDRQSLIDNVTKGGQEPAQWFSRPGLAGCPDPRGLTPTWASSPTSTAAKAELRGLPGREEARPPTSST